jgi:hypothetical protein
LDVFQHSGNEGIEYEGNEDTKSPFSLVAAGDALKLGHDIDMLDGQLSHSRHSRLQIAGIAKFFSLNQSVVQNGWKCPEQCMRKFEIHLHVSPFLGRWSNDQNQ